MHLTALLHAQKFNDVYIAGRTVSVVEVGSQNINGSIREAITGTPYTGVDTCAGSDVDVVLADFYTLPFESSSIDAVVCSSAFEHTQLFWVMFLEVLRVLKPNGLFYVNAPSNGGGLHQYPVDCWRFFPDCGAALVLWGERNGLQPALLESFVGNKQGDIWNDFIGVFIKDKDFASEYPTRMTDTLTAFVNGVVLGSTEYRNFYQMEEGVPLS
jgi:SAM-dependent methyltransferase